MNEKRARYYINGRDVNAPAAKTAKPADDLPPRLRPPNCELPRQARHRPGHVVITLVVASAAVTACGLVALVWRWLR